MAGDARKKPGRKAFEATPEQRATVARMAGATHAKIARVVGCSVVTLRKAFRDELRAPATGELFDAAPRSAVAPRPAAGGRKSFTPTPDQRRRVMDLSAAGKSADAIARIIGVSEPTLRKHFAVEIETGADRVEAEIIETMLRKARAGNVGALKEAHAMLAQARLDRLERELGPQSPPRREAPGKKAQADIDAGEVLASGGWADVLRPN